MGQITDDANTAFRDYVTDGVPGSGAHEPVKSDVRGLFALIDALLAAAGAMAKATVAQVRAATADKALAADHIETASAYVTIPDAATVAVDWSTFFNGTVEVAGNRVIGFPTNLKVGTWHYLEVVQDATGSRAWTWAAGYTFPGGTVPTPSTAAGAVDTFTLHCRSAGEVRVYAGLDMKAPA